MSGTERFRPHGWFSGCRCCRLEYVMQPLGTGDGPRLLFLTAALGSPPGREWVIAVRVPVANPAVLTMNYEFGSLIPGDFTGDAHRLPLGINDPGSPVAACALDGPLLAPRYYVLITLSHGLTVIRFWARFLKYGTVPMDRGRSDRRSRPG